MKPMGHAARPWAPREAATLVLAAVRCEGLPLATLARRFAPLVSGSADALPLQDALWAVAPQRSTAHAEPRRAFRRLRGGSKGKPHLDLAWSCKARLDRPSVRQVEFSNLNDMRAYH